MTTTTMSPAVGDDITNSTEQIERFGYIDGRRDQHRDAVNKLRFRLADPKHPKHREAKKLMGRVERGEITPMSAIRLADTKPMRRRLATAKCAVRGLDDDTWVEFLQWLVVWGKGE